MIKVFRSKSTELSNTIIHKEIHNLITPEFNLNLNNYINYPRKNLFFY